MSKDIRRQISWLKDQIECMKKDTHNGLAFPFNYSNSCCTGTINYESKGRFFTNNNTTPLASVNKFIFNRHSNKDEDLFNIFQTILTLKDNVLLRVQENGNPFVYGFYEVISVNRKIKYCDIDVQPKSGVCFEGFRNGYEYLLGFDIISDSSSTVTGDKNYVHDQGLSSIVWYCNHGLNKYTSPIILDSSGREIEGQIEHVSLNEVIIRFNVPISGKAIFN